MCLAQGPQRSDAGEASGWGHINTISSLNFILVLLLTVLYQLTKSEVVAVMVFKIYLCFKFSMCKFAKSINQ